MFPDSGATPKILPCTRCIHKRKLWKEQGQYNKTSNRIGAKKSMEAICCSATQRWSNWRRSLFDRWRLDTKTPLPSLRWSWQFQIESNKLNRIGAIGSQLPPTLPCKGREDSSWHGYSPQSRCDLEPTEETLCGSFLCAGRSGAAFCTCCVRWCICAAFPNPLTRVLCKREQSSNLVHTCRAS